MTAFILCLALSTVASASPQGDTDPLFLPANAALEVLPDDKGEIGVGELLARFEAVSGWTIRADDETRALLEQTRFIASGPLRAEPEAVTTTVGAVLANFRYCWTVAIETGARSLRVESLETGARTSALANARLVPVEEIARYEAHLALFVQTLVPLAGLDAEVLSNSLRGLLSDPSTCSVTPVGNTGGLIVAGSGRNVANMVALLQDVQRFVRGEAPAAARELAPVLVEGDVVLAGAGDGESAANLFELVHLYAERTGRTAILDRESVSLLARIPLGLPRGKTIAGADFPVLFEELMHAQRFVLGELTLDGALFTVRSREHTARMSGHRVLRYVGASTRPELAAHPATMYLTLMPLPHVDVRVLSNSARGVVVDPSFLGISPAGGANALVLVGFGRELERVRATFADVEAAAATRAAASSLPEGGK